MLQDLPTFKFILSDSLLTWDLPQAPEGWEESFLEWERSVERFGIIRNYSIPLKWTLDGAFFLRNKFYSGILGVQAATKIEIKKLDRPTLQYLPFYEGSIDYSSFSDQNNFVSVNIMDSGLDERIKSYGNTKYDISLNDPDVVEIELPGIELNENANYITDTVPNIDAAIENNAAIVGVTLNGFEQRTNQTTAQSCDYENVNPGDPDTDPLTTTNWFYKASIAGTIRINGSFTFSGFADAGNPTSNFVLFRFSITDGVGITHYNITPSPVEIPNDGIFHDHTFNFDFNAPINANERVLIQYFQTSVFNIGTRVIPSSFTISAKTRSSATKTKALRSDKLFERIIRKVNGGIVGKTKSNLLLNDFNTIYYTCGDALRSLDNPSIKISLNNFLKDWFSIACAGFGIENEFAVLERRDYFLRKSQKIGDLGDVQTALFEVADDYIISTIKVGSPDENYDDLNGRSEVNSIQEWTTSITRISNPYDIVTDSRTDAYGIEFTRVNLIGKKTTDSNSDNDTFIIDAIEKEDGFIAQLKEDRYDEAIGVDAPDSVYNLFLSPKKNLLRHNYWLASALWGLENFYIEFQSALKNAELKTVDFLGNIVIEKEPIYTANLGAKIYFPITATVQCKYDRNLYSLINNTPYGYLEFTWYDNVYRGYILEASFNPETHEDKQFKLLLTSDNNLLSLRK